MWVISSNFIGLGLGFCSRGKGGFVMMGERGGDSEGVPS